MQDLKGRVAVVTGAASGLGRALALQFLQEGMRVAMADVEPQALTAAAADLAAYGEVQAIVTDVSNPASVDALAQGVMERFGTFDVVCNNAGVGGHYDLSWEASLADWRWVLDVNVMGVVHGIRSFVPTLIAQGSGHVVNTASDAGWLTGPRRAAYCASKHAVVAISETLKAELLSVNAGVGVTAWCPSAVRTNLSRSDRNWPERLGGVPAMASDARGIELQGETAEWVSSTGMDPEMAASAVVAAVKANNFLAVNDLDNLCRAAEARLNAAKRAAVHSGKRM